MSTARNHSATHLLHEALRDVLGTHVEQKGSLVNPDYLRFDFSHFAKMTDEELKQVEDQVNRRIMENIPLDEKRDVPLEQAKETGAMMLFGEKYSDLVRVIQFGSSIELCGGTHVPATGHVGYFKIISESAVAAGVRRVECYTGDAAQNYLEEQLEVLKDVRALLKNPSDLTKAVNDLMTKNSELSKEIEKFSKAQAGDIKKTLKDKISEVNGVNFLAEEVPLKAGEIKDVVFQLKGEVDRLFIVLGSKEGGKATLTCMISDELVSEKGLNAGAIIRDLAKEIKGGGGGQPFFATAGGKDPEGIQAALKKATSYLN